MKKSIYIFTLILIGLLTLMSFSGKSIKKKNTASTYYYSVYNHNHETKHLFISNVFSSDEHPNDVSQASEYMENELDYKLDNYRDTHVHSHKEKNYVYDDRLESIEWAKDKGYKVIKFNVKCKNGRLYPK